MSEAGTGGTSPSPNTDRGRDVGDGRDGPNPLAPFTTLVPTTTRRTVVQGWCARRPRRVRRVGSPQRAGSRGLEAPPDPRPGARSSSTAAQAAPGPVPGPRGPLPHCSVRSRRTPTHRRSVPGCVRRAEGPAGPPVPSRGPRAVHRARSAGKGPRRAPLLECRPGRRGLRPTREGPRLAGARARARWPGRPPRAEGAAERAGALGPGTRGVGRDTEALPARPAPPLPAPDLWDFRGGCRSPLGGRPRWRGPA